jgi:hypothetical protein
MSIEDFKTEVINYFANIADDVKFYSDPNQIYFSVRLYRNGSYLDYVCKSDEIFAGDMFYHKLEDLAGKLITAKKDRIEFFDNN